MTEPIPFAREVCVGCGERAGRQPICGITKIDERWVALPVCDLCWRDPAHRTTPVKAHFFPRSQEAIALANAGASSLG